MIARESVEEFGDLGILAFTTLRSAGTFGFAGADPVVDVLARWDALHCEVAVPRIGFAHQVHGVRVIAHSGEWEGWLRVPAADGHVTRERGTALAVTVADCVPVFLAHANGAVALLHAGWRGTAGGILGEGVRQLGVLGCEPAELRVHLGPAICGRCYEVGPDVAASVLGEAVTSPRTVDLRAVLAAQATRLGVRSVSVSRFCTKCDNDRFFSHRAGDAGRQVAVISTSPHQPFTL